MRNIKSKSSVLLSINLVLGWIWEQTRHENLLSGSFIYVRRGANLKITYKKREGHITDQRDLMMYIKRTLSNLLSRILSKNSIVLLPHNHLKNTGLNKLCCWVFVQILRTELRWKRIVNFQRGQTNLTLNFRQLKDTMAR